MPDLPTGVTLRVWDAAGELVFESSAKWLHPLFELTDFLATRPDLVTRSLVLRDRVIGRGAAALILRLGIVRASAELVSQRGISLFASHGLVLEGRQTVERIDCQTEEILAGVDDLDQAWQMLAERRRRALA